MIGRVARRKLLLYDRDDLRADQLIELLKL